MWRKIQDFWYDNLPYAVVILLFALVFLGYAAFDKAYCNSRARDFTHEWYVVGGCMIQADDGRWIPIDNYRYMGD